MARDEFSAATKRRLANRAGQVCSKPGCGAPTIGAQMGDPRGIINVGVAAHITAAASNGPRYDASLTPEQRADDSNGIWLCLLHGKAVDDDDNNFTVETLRGWKDAAEQRSFNNLMRGQQTPAEPALLTPANQDKDGLTGIKTRLLAASKGDVEAFMTGPRWPRHAIKLHLRILDDARRPPFDAAGLANVTRTFNHLVLVAPPGTGKSTSIVQVVQSLTELGVPGLLIPLNDWSVSGLSILDFAVSRRAFSNCAVSDVQRLAEEGEILLALDGWNELDAASRRKASVEIRALVRDYPEIRLLISTRRQALEVPLSGPLLEIDALTEEQQLQIAKGVRGADGETLLDQAWRTAGVRDLVAIPLYLNALLGRTLGAVLPNTKEEVIRLFVAEHERETENADALRSVLAGRHDDVLAALATEATITSNTVISDARARSVVSSVQRQLVIDGQIAAPAEPMQVIDILVAHHSLIRGGESAADVSFQHQQIQEWYASHDVDRTMRSAAGGDETSYRRLAIEILDDPEWEESIFFAVERLSRAGADAVAAASKAVLQAIEIDPMLAAEMIFRSSEEAWKPIASRVIDYGRRWHSPGQVDRAIGFMIRTGRPEFAPDIWPLISDPDTQVHLSALRAAPRFRTSVLGDNAESKLAALPEELRSHVLAEIALRGGFEGLELATRIALVDASDEVRQTTVEALAFRQSDRLVAKLLAGSGDKVWQAVARRGYPDTSTDPAIAERLGLSRAKYLSDETDPLRQIAALTKGNDRSPSVAEIIQMLVSTIELSPTDQNASHVIREAYEQFPEAVSEAFVQRLQANLSIPHGSAVYLRAARAQFDDGPLASVAIGTESPKDEALTAATVLGPTTIGTLIDEAVRLNAKWRTDKGGFSSVDRDRSMRVGDLIAVTRLRPFLLALIQRPADDAVAIGHLADLFARHGVNDEGRALAPPSDLEAAVQALVLYWGETLLAADPFPRGGAANIARVISRLGSPEYLPILTRLLNEDLAARQRALLDAQIAGPLQSAALNDARMVWTTQYQQAFVKIGNEGAISVLIKNLSNVEFGLDSAVALKLIWDREHGIPGNSLRPWPDYSSVKTKRAERGKAQVGNKVDDPFAAAILDAADRLKDSPNSKEQALAITIARIGFGLPHLDRPDLSAALLSLSGHRAAKQLLLATLVLDGMLIDANMILSGIQEYLDEARTKTWMLTESRWELEAWLELMPFTDRPAATLDAVALLPPACASPYHLRRLLIALGESPADGIEEILVALAERDPRFRAEFEWLAAFEKRGTITAVRSILQFLANGEITLTGHRHDVWGIGRTIAGAMIRDPNLRAQLLEIYPDVPTGPARSALELAFSEDPDAASVLQMLARNGAEGRSLNQSPLRQAIERVMVEHRPSTYWKSAQDIFLVANSELRRAIFTLTTSCGPIAALASECLLEMDVIRDRHDWAVADPRHPDITSGRPWPLSLAASNEARGNPA